MKLGIPSICDPTGPPVIVGELPTAPPHPDCTVWSVDAAPEVGRAPLTVRFEADADCSDPSVHYAWDFGDGSTGGDTPRPSHTYEQPGVYTATVVVRSPDPDCEPDELPVTVKATAK